MQLEDSSGIYIHIPFCHHKCIYCDFYSVTSLEAIDSFLDALHKEIHLSSDAWKEKSFDTIYFGGGTPSILSPEAMEHILSNLKNNFQFLPDTEITVEANPGTLNSDKAVGYRETGVNRVSLGIQSFNESELKFLERIHNTEEIYSSFTDLRGAGLNNISIDLISAIPGQKKENLIFNLKEAIQLNPEHISAYSLIIEANTPLGAMTKEGKIIPFDEDSEADYYLSTIEHLEKHGYQWYEVSNFSKTDKLQSRHNNKYWNLIPYLGLGPSAHSFSGTRRWSNPRSLKKYNRELINNRIPSINLEELDKETIMTEYAFLGLRQKKGINKDRFKEMFSCTFDEVFNDFVLRFEKSPWLRNEKSSLFLTRKGLLLCDEIASYLKVEKQCVSS